MDKSLEEKLFYLMYLLLTPSALLVDGISGPVLTVIGVVGLFYLTLKRYRVIKTDISGSVDRFLGKEDEKLSKASKIGIGLYIASLLYIILKANMSVTPDQMLFIGLLGALILKRGKSFVWDWAPFVSLIVAYDAMRGVADELAGAAHYLEPIIAEKILFFGNIPTIWLQDLLFVPGRDTIFSVAAVFFYSTHFVSMMFFAYILWVADRRMFDKYKASIILVSYAALVTFLMYPVAPPWLAAEKGYLPPLKDVVNDVGIIPAVYIETIYFHLNANDVAAVPSLHMAYPWLILLYSLRVWGRRALPVLALPLGVAYGAVYLGHHYVVDLIIGVLYSMGAYYVVERLIKD